jgi:hypothetical protein
MTLAALWKKRFMIILSKIVLQHTPLIIPLMLNEVFEYRLVTRGLWPASSLDLNSCNFLSLTPPPLQKQMKCIQIMLTY